MPHNQVLTMLDMNKDGKLDADDYKFASQRALTLLEANGKVAAGAFVAGFAYGFGPGLLPSGRAWRSRLRRTSRRVRPGVD